jgi:phospholipid/cholesterol/gamma-HCH transport system permease protein
MNPWFLLLRPILAFFYHLGGVGELLWGTLLAFREIKKVPRLLWDQLSYMAAGSLPIVLVTSAFVGMVAAVQTAYQIRDFVPMMYLGVGVAKAVMIELGPVLVALVFAGRVGAGIAAELGTMRVTEQIDALELMAIDPYRYLALPRFLGGLISVPLLTILGECVALIGALFVARYVLFVPVETFTHGMRIYFVAKDLFGGLAKSVVFGAIVSLMGIYCGYNAKGGAVGVGKATTQAVVASSLLILAADYVLGTIIFGGQ